MKKLIIAAIALSVAVVASADVLYWMVGDNIAATASENDNQQFAALYVTGGGVEPDPMQIMSVTGSQVYNMYDPDGGTTAFTYTGIEAFNKTGYNFYVEILADGAYKGNKTTPVSYAQLSDFIFSGTTQPSSTMMAGFGGGAATYNVPEPTSGLLFLVGGMLLGLKRRRQQV